MKCGEIPLGEILAATAASVLPMNPGSVGMSFDTGATTNINHDVSSRKIDSAELFRPPAFNFDFNGWFSYKMPIPGTDAFIKFRRCPQVMMDYLRTVSIPEWGVSLQIDKLSPESLRHATVRQYRLLADKARRNSLTEQERVWWKNLLADSDFADYCQRTAPALIDTGTRTCAVEGGVSVVWSGGESETIPESLAEQLAIIEDGEQFSARVKFIDGAIHSLSDVVPLGKPQPVDFDDLFGIA